MNIRTEWVGDPDPRYRWLAVDDDDTPGMMGWGATKEEAVADLKRLQDEERCAHCPYQFVSDCPDCPLVTP